MGGEKKKWLAPSATPWDGVPEDELTPAQALVAESHRSIYGFRHEAFPGDADFFNGYPRSECPGCGGRLAKAGLGNGGIQRYRCAECGAISTPVTGTIFDNRKLPVSAWAGFILQAVSYESVAAMAREGRRSETTPPYWMAKLFAALEGIQDDVVLSGTVWLDEAYWPVAAKDAVRRPDGKLPRGLSRNQICIGVAVDDSGRSYLRREGFGKTSKTKTRDAFGGHIARGSKLVHDMEGAHDILVEKLGLESERHNSKLLKGVPDKLNPLDPVNRICFLLKRFLASHSGFDRDDLQGYLDLFSVAVNEPENKLEKVAMVLDRAMRCPKTLRFREFYNVHPRSDEAPDDE